MKSGLNTICKGCGEGKGPRQVVCNFCWHALPAELKAAFRDASRERKWERAAAIRRILAHVTRQPELPLN